MRKIVFGWVLASALLLAAACENTIRYEYDRNDGQITLLSQMYTSETEHTVILSMSYPDRVEALTGASVVCYVNDVRHVAEEQAPRMVEQYEYDPVNDEDVIVVRPQQSNHTEYVFSAVFRPGDQVRVEASKGALKAWAEVTVPQPATLVKADTTMVERTIHYVDIDGDYSYEDAFMDIAVTIRDVPGEDNYYSLTASSRVEGEFRYLDDEGAVTKTEWYSAEDKGISYETFHDKILEDGYSAGDASSLLEDFLATNEMHCFSDKEFKDGEAVLHPSFDAYRFRPGGFEYYYWMVPEAQEGDLHTVFTLHLRSFDRDFYNYLRAINNMQTYGYDVTPIIEPTMLPNNVVGGFGMVSVAAEETVSFDLGTVHIHRDPEIYY